MIAPLLVLASSLSAWAQAQKFATIDMQAALLNTKDGQKAVAELKAKFTPKEQEFQKRQSDLQAKQDQYRKTENTISEEAKATLAREIDTMTKNLQRDTDDVRQDIDQEQQRVLNELGQKMMQVLQKYATDKGLAMIVDTSGQPNPVLYASNTIDITREIISLYDAAAPATTTAAPSSGAPAIAPKAPAATTPAPVRRPAPATPAPTPAPK
jgi:outer membrane protein